MDMEYVIFVTVLIQGVVPYSDPATDLSAALFSGYDPKILAKCGSPNATQLILDLAVRQVIELDEPRQVLKLILWVRLQWTDCRLTWDPVQYSNISHIEVPYKYIWTPDITLYDSVATEFVGLDRFRPKIYWHGTILYNFPSLIESVCTVDVRKFPYDTQVCKMVFGSWTYHGEDLNLTYRSPYGDLASAEQNVEWEIVSFTATRHVTYYGCCNEPFPDVTFYLTLKRRPNSYVLNIIVPSLLIATMATLGFFLPVESGEKVSLQITVMLSLTVFQLLVADRLPPSDATPLIAWYFNFTLFLVGSSCLTAVVVIATHYQDANKSIPSIIRLVFLKWLSKLGCKYSFKQMQNEEDRDENKSSNKISPLSEDDMNISTIKSLIGLNEVTEKRDSDFPNRAPYTREEELDQNQKEQSEISTKKEWVLIAVIVNRVSCVVFLVTLIIGLCIIFSKFQS